MNYTILTVIHLMMIRMLEQEHPLVSTVRATFLTFLFSHFYSNFQIYLISIFSLFLFFYYFLFFSFFSGMCDLQGSVSSWRPNKKKETLPIINNSMNIDLLSSTSCNNNIQKNIDHSQ